MAANPTLQTLGQQGAKPNFFLYDKVYRKAATVEDGTWLCRALSAYLASSPDHLATDESLRAAFAAAVAHCATDGASHEIRREAVELVRSGVAHAPKLVHLAIREGIRAWLVSSEKVKAPLSAKAAAGDEPDAPVDHAGRLRPLLNALVSFEDHVDAETREELVAELVVVAHHPRLSASEASFWVDLLLRAKVDPEKLIAERLQELLDLVLADASLAPKNEGFTAAAYRAAATLALVHPAKAIPAIFAQFEDDLEPSHLAFIGATEFGVWGTPAGQAFVDVLAAAKDKAKAATPVGKANSKEHQIALWEAELRESLARKKPVAAQLSKQDRAALEKQLALEDEIRSQVAAALARLKRGFQLALCLVRSRAELVREYLASMVEKTLAVITLQPTTLVAREAFETYQALAEICSERLGVFKVALGVAVLRSVEAQVVPEDFRAEPLPDLVSRVLFQLRYLAEQQPFDAGTFAYAAPLVSKILRTGGVGIAAGAEGSNAMEQLALALDFVSFHARQCGDTAFPRVTLIGDLFAALTGYPALSRVAATALGDLGEAIQDSASVEEVAAILDGALTEEAFVRLAALQALQVRLPHVRTVRLRFSTLTVCPIPHSLSTSPRPTSRPACGCSPTTSTSATASLPSPCGRRTASASRPTSSRASCRSSATRRRPSARLRQPPSPRA